MAVTRGDVPARISPYVLPKAGGQGVASSNLASPTKAIHPIRLSRTCIQLTLLPLDNADRRACRPRHLRVLPSRRSCGSGAPRTPPASREANPELPLLPLLSQKSVDPRASASSRKPPRTAGVLAALQQVQLGTPEWYRVSDAAPVTERAGCCGLGGTGSADRRWP
jgi:hypothetical protein